MSVKCRPIARSDRNQVLGECLLLKSTWQRLRYGGQEEVSPTATVGDACACQCLQGIWNRTSSSHQIVWFRSTAECWITLLVSTLLQYYVNHLSVPAQYTGDTLLNGNHLRGARLSQLRRCFPPQVSLRSVYMLRPMKRQSVV